MLTDIVKIIGAFILAVIVATFPILLYFLIKTRRIINKIPKDMIERIEKHKLNEQEVKNERKTRRLRNELGRRTREREPTDEFRERIREHEERVESLQVDGANERQSTSEFATDNDDGTDLSAFEID